MTGIWYLFSLVFLLLAILLETRFPLYAFQKRVMVRLTLRAPVFLLLGILGSIIEIVLHGVNWLLVVLVVSYWIIRYVIFYGKSQNRFVDYTFARANYTSFISEEPEMAVVYLDSHPLINDHSKFHIIPTRVLMVNDLILSIPMKDGQGEISTRYSLSFCTLCNTIHAYILPQIDGKEIEISSNRAMVMNGNKILADSSGKYIWQQFSGEPLSDNLPKLQELRVVRMTWKQLDNRFTGAQYYHHQVKSISYQVFSVVRSLVRSISFAALSRGGKNHRLPNKELIVGMDINGETRAYPLSLFTTEIMLLEDLLGGISFTIVYQGHGSQAFEISGLTITNKILIKNEKKWYLDGSALGDYEDLPALPVTDLSYWYLWNQFHPNTTIYQQNR